MPARPDHNLGAFAAALRRAVAGETEAERLAGAEAVLAALRPLLHAVAAKGRGGRRRVHNRSWAESQLIAMTADVDGLPDCQAEVVERLQLRFENAGKVAPGRTWAHEVVGEFLARSRIHETEARERFFRSANLLSAFGTVENYVRFCSWRMRVEERWVSEKDLQRRYQTPGHYVAEMIEQTPWTKSDSSVELADVSG